MSEVPAIAFKILYSKTQDLENEVKSLKETGEKKDKLIKLLGSQLQETKAKAEARSLEATALFANDILKLSCSHKADLRRQMSHSKRLQAQIETQTNKIKKLEQLYKFQGHALRPENAQSNAAEPLDSCEQEVSQTSVNHLLDAEILEEGHDPQRGSAATPVHDQEVLDFEIEESSGMFGKASVEGKVMVDSILYNYHTIIKEVRPGSKFSTFSKANYILFLILALQNKCLYVKEGSTKTPRKDNRFTISKKNKCFFCYKTVSNVTYTSGDTFVTIKQIDLHHRCDRLNTVKYLKSRANTKRINVDFVDILAEKPVELLNLASVLNKQRKLFYKDYITRLVQLFGVPMSSLEMHRRKKTQLISNIIAIMLYVSNLNNSQMISDINQELAKNNQMLFDKQIILQEAKKHLTKGIKDLCRSNGS